MGNVLTILSGIDKAVLSIFSKVYILVIVLTFFTLWLVTGTPFSLELPPNASAGGKSTYTFVMIVLFNVLLPFFIFGLALIVLFFFAGLILDLGSRK